MTIIFDFENNITYDGTNFNPQIALSNNNIYFFLPFSIYDNKICTLQKLIIGEFILCEVISDGSSVWFIKLILKDGSKLVLKNSFLFLGIKSKTEINSEESLLDFKDFLKQLFVKLQNIILFLKNLNINVESASSPGAIALFIFYKINIKTFFFIINQNQYTYSAEQIIYKYYWLLRYDYKFYYLANHYKYYSHLINYNYVGNREEWANIVMPLNKTNMQTKINKTLTDTKFFEKVLHYTTNNNPLFFAGEDSFGRSFLVGGRTEIFSNYNKTCTDIDNFFITFDLPSAYFNLLKTKFPVGLPIIHYNPPLTLNIFKTISFFDCEVYWSPKLNMLPILPYHTNNKVIYPEGKFRGIWFSEEILLFLENGGLILNIFTQYTWETVEYSFSNFVTYIENIPLCNHTDFLKKLKVTFYGNLIRKPLTQITQTYDKNFNFLTSDEKIITYPSNFFIGAIITSRCRIKMYNVYKTLLHLNINIISIYIDSITVICSYSQYLNLYASAPKYKELWNKNNLYDDMIFINLNFVLFKKIGNLYYEDYWGQKYNFNEIEKLKNFFFSSQSTVILNNSLPISLDSYQHRIWVKNRKNTIPINLDFANNTVFD